MIPPHVVSIVPTSLSASWRLQATVIGESIPDSRSTTSPLLFAPVLRIFLPICHRNTAAKIARHLLPTCGWLISPMSPCCSNSSLQPIVVVVESWTYHYNQPKSHTVIKLSMVQIPPKIFSPFYCQHICSTMSPYSNKVDCISGVNDSTGSISIANCIQYIDICRVAVLV